MRGSTFRLIGAVASLAMAATTFTTAQAAHTGVGAPDVEVRIGDAGAVNLAGDRVRLGVEVRCEPLSDYQTGWVRLDLSVTQDRDRLGSGYAEGQDHDPPCTGDWEPLALVLRGTPLAIHEGAAHASAHLYFYGYHDAQGGTVYGRGEDADTVQLQRELVLDF